ncbi:MAG: diacylglycerol kinase [bacterium]|nr:diacylglycerol kinase [bacterium]
MPYRVIQWSTGNVGKLALRAIINHPELELVGLWVSSDAKAGRDAGEIAGLAPVGVRATTDAEALLAQDADCVCYTATADLRPAEAIEDICRILRAGKNVVSSSFVPLVYPPAAPADMVEQLEQACRDGNTSCYTSGIDPGFANDALPLLLMSACERVDSVRVMEIVNYDTYDQPTVLFETMGFAKPLDHTPLLLIPGVLTLAWGSVVKILAAGLGVEVEEIREIYEKIPTERAFDIRPGHVPAGTMAALRFEVQGLVGGRPRIVLEHVTRLRDDLAPDWPQPVGDSRGCYRVVVEGSPRFVCDLAFEGEDGDHNTGGLVATALRLLNAIPAVCAARPGLLSPLDLPLYTARGLMV